MSAVFSLSGGYKTHAASGVPSGNPEVIAGIREQVALSNQTVGTLTLEADGETALPLGALSAANVLVLKTIGGKIALRYTSADGASQAVPVDSFIAHISQTADITALSVERVSGQQVIVEYFIGERA